MPTQPDPNAPLGAEFRAGIDAAITGFLDARAGIVDEIGAGPMLELAREFTGGGKRLRPAFCYWSRVAVGGPPEAGEPLLRAAASLDLLHVSALVHDDIIDASETRRGVPAAHRQFTARHRDLGGEGDPDAYGRSAAILLGDLLLVWSDEMFETCGLAPDALARARPLLAAMRTEVTCGQFLDIGAAHRVAGADSPGAELRIARRVLEYKSASYTVRRPAQIGAALGGADPATLDALGTFGSHLGAAFQLRDDVLGVFGDPASTGKPRGGDLREGKRTILVLAALDRGDRSQRARLAALLGDAELDQDSVDDACAIIEETGALGHVEALIAAGTEAALHALGSADLTPAGRTALLRLAELSVRRDR